ncbi:MAG: ACT domain-containing protein [Deltaproteobacteria bacterium]|nr:ACT domain-containing protein [Deltaproteobacteria bacterium]
MRSLVLTLIGPDRPGVVERISDCVARHHGNWLGSRMAHLAGQFAGILHLEVPDEHAVTLRSALDNLQSRDGLRLIVEEATIPIAQAAGSMVVVDLVGQDRPGIVSELSEFFASQHLNVEELATDRENAAMSGEALFRARVRLTVPPTMTIAELHRGIERLADDLMVEIRLDEVK